MPVDKVNKTIARNNLLQSGDRVLVGVSGGPDSLCLLHLLANLQSELNIKVFAGHLNHGFRPEANREFDYVRFLAGKWRIPFYGSRADIPSYRKKAGLSAQEAARHYRYRFLLKAARYFGADKIATGHHRDDQVETVLLNILHGAGQDGIAGIKALRAWKGIKIIRPLLEISKDEINGYCLENAIEPVYDASNLKKIYRRNKVRLELIPYLEREYNPRIRDALLRLASLAKEDNAYMEKTARHYLALFSAMQGREKVLLNTRKIRGLALALQRRLLRAAWEKIVSDMSLSLKAEHIDSVIRLYQKGDTGKEISLPGGGRAYNVHEGLVVSLQKPSRVKPGAEPVTLLNIPGKTALPGAGMTFEAVIKKMRELKWPPDKKKEAYFDYDKIKLPLKVRYRQPGDLFKPLGMGGKKRKLKNFFIDEKIPRQERDAYPLVVSEDEIIWVTGTAVAHPCRVTGNTRRALVLRIINTGR